MEKKAVSELESLFVEESEPALDSLLFSALEPFAGLTRQGAVVTKAAFLKLSVSSRILVVLLARLAAVRLRVADSKPDATPENLSSECMAPLKTCREMLSRMKKHRLLTKTANGYAIPYWAVTKAASEITGKK